MGKNELQIVEVVDDRQEKKSKTLFQRFRNQTLFRAAATIVAGLVMVIFPSMTQSTIAYVLSIVLVLFGLFRLLRYFHKTDRDGDGDLEYGSPVDFVVGVVFIVLAGLVAKMFISIIPLVFGIFILICGVLKLEQGIALLRVKSNKAKPVMIIAAVTVAIGLFAAFNPFSAGRVLIVIIGAGLLFSGITDLVTAGFVSKIMKD
ncbi:MAG: DUF308 domain-containing protein [Lachnospiraceae bacterium]|nr:DUF308 domain-containing protein [Lachnospiraceae bacterium]